jgi:hypothetical protein
MTACPKHFASSLKKDLNHLQVFNIHLIKNIMPNKELNICQWGSSALPPPVLQKPLSFKVKPTNRRVFHLPEQAVMVSLSAHTVFWDLLSHPALTPLSFSFSTKYQTGNSLWDLCFLSRIQQIIDIIDKGEKKSIRTSCPFLVQNDSSLNIF